MKYQVIAHHVELHDSKSDKFWRCYYFSPHVGIWVRHWGPCYAPQGQYKLEHSPTSGTDATSMLQGKVTKGYGGHESRSWEVTEGFGTAISLGKGLPDLGYQFNQHLGGTFEIPLEEVIAGLQLVRDSLSGR